MIPRKNMEVSDLVEYVGIRFPKINEESFIASFGLTYIVCVFILNKSTIPIQNLFITLYFLKNYNTFGSMHWIFGVDERTCRDIVWNTIDELDEILPHLELWYRFEYGLDCTGIFQNCWLAVDGTERPVERPKEETFQTKLYSGKKKTHTLKHQVIVDLFYGMILDFTNAITGSTHDATIYNHWLHLKGFLLSENERILGDKGYQGCYRVITPKKEPESDVEREYNSMINKTRVIVENTLGRLKKFKSVALEWRHDLNKESKVFSVCCKLCNLDMCARPIRNKPSSVLFE